MNRVLVLVILSTLVSACAAQTQQQPSGGDAQMQQMQDRMQAMHAQMQRIDATSDPQERQRLMREHMQSMREGMTMMDQMMGHMLENEAAAESHEEHD